MFSYSMFDISTIACDASCASCRGPDTCLTCGTNRLMLGGKCVSSCPTNSFTSDGRCQLCHPDCATCSGSRFNQCSSCSPDRPVLLNGRCVPACGKTQFFDKTTSKCQDCDASCSSCSGAGPAGCLACAKPTQILLDGDCVDAICGGGSHVIARLGVCLSQLISGPLSSARATTVTVSVHSTSSIQSTSPTNSVSSPRVVRPPTTGFRISWWQILLCGFGGLFVLLMCITCWRCYIRKKRYMETIEFANGKGEGPSEWELFGPPSEALSERDGIPLPRQIGDDFQSDTFSLSSCYSQQDELY